MPREREKGERTRAEEGRERENERERWLNLRSKSLASSLHTQTLADPLDQIKGGVLSDGKAARTAN